MLLLMVSGAALAGPFVGIDYGPFHKNGQKPHTPIPDSQFISDLGILSQKFKEIKTYGDDSESRLDRLVPIAAGQFKQLKIHQGVYEDATYNSSKNKTYLDTAIRLANTYPATVAEIVVGNECLNKDFTKNPITVAQLIADLKYVRNGLKNKGVKVTTALDYASALKYGAQLKPHVDSMMINIYPFFGPVAIGGAVQNLIDAYNMFNKMFSGKPVVIGETGWPSAGDKNGPAVPTVENEATFIRGTLSRSDKLGATFLFSAFDEPWKSVQGSWAPHWGLWTMDSEAKFTFDKAIKSRGQRLYRRIAKRISAPGIRPGVLRRRETLGIPRSRRAESGMRTTRRRDTRDATLRAGL